MIATWLARVGVVAAVSILSSDIVIEAAPPQIFRDSRLFTVGTVGSGTQLSVDVPDLGVVAAVCSANGDATATLTSSVLFDWLVATTDGSAGFLDQTSWTSGHVHETLWLKNAAGQWRLEYFAHPSPEPNTPVCRVAVEVTRIN